MLEASSPGSGKGLLARLIGLVAEGRAPSPMSLPEQTNEVRKRLTAALERGQSIIQLDNVNHHLDSGDLAAALTAEVWSDRALGATRMLDLPNRALWLLCANNPSLSLETARRCIRVRLEPACKRPWERDGFRHDPLEPWVIQNRGTLVWAALTLVKEWIADGRPRGGARLGSFDDWAATMSGILEVAGVPRFIGDQDDLYSEADRETTE